MATRDALTFPPQTGGFKGYCWVLPPSGEPRDVAEQINDLMTTEAVILAGDRLVLKQTGLMLQDRQIITILIHGGQANLYVCDSMEVHQ